MIRRLYDFRQVPIPAALLQAEVTREELDGELHRMAARFTDIVATQGPVCAGDVVTLEFTDPTAENGIGRVWANVGRDFDDIEALLPGLRLGEEVPIAYAGRQVLARIVGIKRLQVPALTQAHVTQLGIDGVETVEALEDHLFARLAESQRKRKFRGILGIVSKAVLQNTEFAPMEESHPWYQALHGQLMGRLEALAAREGKSVEEVMPMALRMADASVEQCRQAVQDMCLERAHRAALGQAYAKEQGVELGEAEDLTELLERCDEYFEQAIYAYTAPQIQVTRN